MARRRVDEMMMNHLLPVTEKHLRRVGFADGDTFQERLIGAHFVRAARGMDVKFTNKLFALAHARSGHVDERYKAALRRQEEPKRPTHLKTVK